MAQSRLSMRKICDVLRLSAAGLSKRQIAASLGIGPTAAGACLRRAREAGISWPLPDDLGDAALECRLYCNRNSLRMPRIVVAFAPEDAAASVARIEARAIL